MKKKLTILLAVLFLITAFAGCSSKSKNEETQSVNNGNYGASSTQGEEHTNSVVVEYVNNEMIVTDTPAVTNFYLAEGEKKGIGTQQSHERYEILINRLNNSETMEMDDVRDVLDSVSKDNFGEFERSSPNGLRSRGSRETDSECPIETTEWSIVMNQTTGEVRYYHREDYNTAYTFTVH